MNILGLCPLGAFEELKLYFNETVIRLMLQLPYMMFLHYVFKMAFFFVVFLRIWHSMLMFHLVFGMSSCRLSGKLKFLILNPFCMQDFYELCL